jgi:hypothetical protein
MAAEIEDEVVILLDDSFGILILLLENGQFEDSDELGLKSIADEVEVFDQIPA